MKLKDGFVLQDVAGETVVLPAGNELDMNMMITLNDSARFLWELLEKEITKEELVEALLSEYGIDRGTAQRCVDDFTNELAKNDFLA